MNSESVIESINESINYSTKSQLLLLNILKKQFEDKLEKLQRELNGTKELLRIAQYQEDEDDEEEEDDYYNEDEKRDESAIPLPKPKVSRPENPVSKQLKAPEIINPPFMDVPSCLLDIKDVKSSIREVIMGTVNPPKYRKDFLDLAYDNALAHLKNEVRISEEGKTTRLVWIITAGDIVLKNKLVNTFKSDGYEVNDNIGNCMHLDQMLHSFFHKMDKSKDEIKKELEEELEEELEFKNERDEHWKEIRESKETEEERKEVDEKQKIEEEEDKRGFEEEEKLKQTPFEELKEEVRVGDVFLLSVKNITNDEKILDGLLTSRDVDIHTCMKNRQGYALIYPKQQKKDICEEKDPIKKGLSMFGAN